MQENNPFLVMDENRNRIDIHPELRIIFDFLIQIESEVKEFLGYNKRLLALKKQCSEILDLVLKLNPPEDFKFTLSEHPETLADKFHFGRPIRCEFIVLFAHLETLRCLNTAYEKKTSDRNELKDASDKAMDKFLNEFCLCKNNQWVAKNSERARNICAKDLRELRNSLTHFFSVSKIGLSPLSKDEIAAMNKKIKLKIQFLSSDDLNEILYSAARLLLGKWSDDCKKHLSENDSNFLDRIRCVKDVVFQNGARFISDQDMNKIMGKIEKI